MVASYRVAIIVFNGVDVLDFCGPLEVLTAPSRISTSSASKAPIQPILIAAAPTVRCMSPMTVSRDMSIADAHAQLVDWDAVIVPGGPPEIIKALLTAQDKDSAGVEIMEFLKAFTALDAAAAEGKRERVIMSVCTGALFLGATGILEGKKATTHHQAVDELRQIAGPGTEVVGFKRWIDGGLVEGGRNGRSRGLRVVTAGGISSGLDASLYFVSLLGGAEVAKVSARMMEYQWRIEEEGK
jgi:transcriptional regulator GlxA family with amidase domain